jgi:hypothetical protein
MGSGHIFHPLKALLYSKSRSSGVQKSVYNALSLPWLNPHNENGTLKELHQL